MNVRLRESYNARNVDSDQIMQLHAEVEASGGTTPVVGSGPSSFGGPPPSGEATGGEGGSACLLKKKPACDVSCLDLLGNNLLSLRGLDAFTQLQTLIVAQNSLGAYLRTSQTRSGTIRHTRGPARTLCPMCPLRFSPPNPASLPCAHHHRFYTNPSASVPLSLCLPLFLSQPPSDLSPSPFYTSTSATTASPSSSASSSSRSYHTSTSRSTT